MKIKHNYYCSRCKSYDNLNGYFCRICGNNVQFDDKARGKILHTRVTDEKFCDHCGKEWHGGTLCKAGKKLIR